ncbi:MAG: helix-hairpin-helix domain-containing protein [Acidobacteriota bacterium]
MLRDLTILIVAFAMPALAQNALPEGAGKLTTVRVCTGCHGAEMFAGARKSQSEWDHTVASMTTEKGIEISDADYATVVRYLSTNLGPLTSKININKATAAELEKALALTAKSAEAIVQYREKNGSYKDLDAVKKVEGVDGAALDPKKDRIEF